MSIQDRLCFWLPLALLAIVLITAFPSPARTENPPVPLDKSEALEDIQDVLEAEKQRQEKLDATIKSIRVELESNRLELINSAGAIRSSETRLEKLEQRIGIMSREQAEIEDRLEHDRKAIADLLLALERMRRVPPEAMIARPGAPLQTAQGALLMRSIIPSVHHRADLLKEDLLRLETLLQALQTDRKEVIARRSELRREHAQMESKLRKREALYKQTSSEYDRRDRRIAEISAQAKSLEDLVQKLAEDRRRASARQMTHKAAANHARQQAQIPATAPESRPEERIREASAALPARTLPQKGEAMAPVTGNLRIGYGETNDIGAKNEGITFDARPGALIVAPMSGIVRFAGDFKAYGKLIILEHKNGYHSLIAGSAKIDTVVGRTVVAGEPIGLMPEDSQESLYFELRQNSRPVDPMTKLADLG